MTIPLERDEDRATRRRPSIASRSRTDSRREALARGAAAALVVAIVATFVYATQPAIRKPMIWETASWGLLLLVSFGGWGRALEHVLFPGRRADLGLCMAWGASAILFVGALIAAASQFSRGVVLVLVDVGLVAAAVFLVRGRQALIEDATFVYRVARQNRLLALMLGVLLAATVVHYLGGVADTSSNPYDDDVAYLPFVKKLLQTGTLVEPFSFRRLSALGGQTLYLALLAPHADSRHLNAFDRGVCVVMVIALILGHRKGARRMPLFLTILTLGFVLSLPNNSINTAAHFAGFALFLALYRTMAWIETEDRVVAKSVVLALVAAATCTLRQNYLSVPVLMLASGYAYRVLGTKAGTFRDRLREPALVCGLSFVALLPWLVLAYRSNDTFLFPLQDGTFRRAMDLKSPSLNMFKEVRFLISVALENEPIKGLGLIALASVMIRERTSYKPLRSLWIASAVGVVVLSHTFTLSDAGNLARYLYGFLAALAVAAILHAGTDRLAGRSSATARATLVLVIAAMAAQFTYSRQESAKMYHTFLKNLDVERRRGPSSPETMTHEAFLYPHVQSQVPKGASLAVMVDDPYYLDFARNPIFNLDMPGYASLKNPEMPYFKGSEPVAEYFLAHGIRYVMYVRPEHSHWLYQREFWFARMFNDEEIWRICAPYFVDLIDSLTALRDTRQNVHEEAGIVVLDLATRK